MSKYAIMETGDRYKDAREKAWKVGEAAVNLPHPDSEPYEERTAEAICSRYPQLPKLLVRLLVSHAVLPLSWDKELPSHLYPADNLMLYNFRSFEEACADLRPVLKEMEDKILRFKEYEFRSTAFLNFRTSPERFFSAVENAVAEVVAPLLPFYPKPASESPFTYKPHVPDTPDITREIILGIRRQWRHHLFIHTNQHDIPEAYKLAGIKLDPLPYDPDAETRFIPVRLPPLASILPLLNDWG